MSMPGRAWQAIRRCIAPGNAVAGAGSETGRTRRVDLDDNGQSMLRVRLRRALHIGKQVIEWLEGTQHDSERMAQEALRKERRARRRSLVLLLKLMNHDQRQEFRKCRYFHVTGAASGERYRIRTDLIANIDVLRDDGGVKYRLCVGPTGVPVYDVMAAQLLHLQDASTEQRFLQQANILSALSEEHGYFRTMWSA